MEQLDQVEGTTNETAAANAGTAAAPAEQKSKTPGVGDVAKDLIRSGLGNKEVLEQIKVQFPDAKTSMSSINWYRNHLRSEGEDVKTARELAAAGKPSKEELEAKKAEAKAAKKAEAEKAKADKKAQKAAEKEAAKQAKKDAAAETSTDATSADGEAAEGSQDASGDQSFMS